MVSAEAGLPAVGAVEMDSITELIAKQGQILAQLIRDGAQLANLLLQAYSSGGRVEGVIKPPGDGETGL